METVSEIIVMHSRMTLMCSQILMETELEIIPIFSQTINELLTRMGME